MAQKTGGPSEGATIATRLDPQKIEDYDGFQDDDSLPDYDNDADGVPDAVWSKNGRWENLDGVVDSGIVVDCRNRPEDFDCVCDDDGCPDAVSFDRIDIAEVQFDSCSSDAYSRKADAITAAGKQIMTWRAEHGAVGVAATLLSPHSAVRSCAQWQRQLEEDLIMAGVPSDFVCFAGVVPFDDPKPRVIFWQTPPCPQKLMMGG